ncbi:hypothetical protein HanIR_Chr07g0338161 [Helianthus annuus]|nr:hypothetical protein HanIR_Chr07g0338161 [Helianthus annuus]
MLSHFILIPFFMSSERKFSRASFFCYISNQVSEDGITVFSITHEDSLFTVSFHKFCSKSFLCYTRMRNTCYIYSYNPA